MSFTTTFDRSATGPPSMLRQLKIVLERLELMNTLDYAMDTWKAIIRSAQSRDIDGFTLHSGTNVLELLCATTAYQSAL
ncbi:hypothetical protein FRB95_003479 [Tulasnella sp. JGI-2019a]|nr:hypothetical protein FRB95_003479 [Tulasnella sp. JGI-2019a]